MNFEGKKFFQNLMFFYSTSGTRTINHLYCQSYIYQLSHGTRFFFYLQNTKCTTVL